MDTEHRTTGEPCFYCNSDGHGPDDCPMSDEDKERVIYGRKVAAGTAETAAFVVADQRANPLKYGACATCGRTDVLIQVAGSAAGYLTLHDRPDGVSCPSNSQRARPAEVLNAEVVLAFIRSQRGRTASAPEIARYFGVSERAALRLLKAMRDAGQVRMFQGMYSAEPQ
jgi:hypothetical protein